MAAFASLILLLGLPQKGLQKAMTKPEGTPISLTGMIRFVHGYGPPGWGEDPKHDAHITYWVLDLSEPVTTPCTPSSPERAAEECSPAKRLRLIVEGDDRLLREAKSSVDRKATVMGRLERQDTAGEMTPIYIDPTEIQPVAE
jgi:hypothetical protein